MSGGLYVPGRALARFCFCCLGRMEVTGPEGTPPYGPLLVVANHISYNDPPAVAAAVPPLFDFPGQAGIVCRAGPGLAVPPVAGLSDGSGGGRGGLARRP